MKQFNTCRFITTGTGTNFHSLDPSEVSGDAVWVVIANWIAFRMSNHRCHEKWSAWRYLSFWSMALFQSLSLHPSTVSLGGMMPLTAVIGYKRRGSCTSYLRVFVVSKEFVGRFGNFIQITFTIPQFAIKWCIMQRGAVLMREGRRRGCASFIYWHKNTL